MTGSKSANVDQPLPGPLPQQPDSIKPSSSPDETSLAEDNAQTMGLRHGPIPPASEPLQYRAIGLIRGVYVPSEEQFTRGHIATGDEDAIDAVLLGRVMSLVKKHVDLAQPHLWVVYPRTRPGNNDLHAQIVGIWDPENLNQEDDLLEDAPDLNGAELDASDQGEVVDDADDESGVSSNGSANVSSAVDDDAELVQAAAPSVSPPMKPKPLPTAAPTAATPNDPQDGYFSIRGEVIRQVRGGDDIMIKICQAPRKGEKRGRAFKLLLKGTIERRAIGAFWDMHIQRQGNNLVITEANFIKDMPPTKRRGRGPARRRGAPSGPPRRRQDKPVMANHRDRGGERRAPSRPVPKPIIKRQRSSSAPSE